MAQSKVHTSVGSGTVQAGIPASLLDDDEVQGARATPRRAAVPVLYVRGTHYDIGYDMGRTFRAMIQEFVKTYDNLRQFEQEYRTVTGRDAYERTLANATARYPHYVAEMKGISDGSNVPFYKLFLLQMDDLIGTINDNQIPRKDTGGCSSIAVNKPSGALLGHTEDAFTETLDHFYIVSAHVLPSPLDRENGAVEERFASLCYAGHLPGYTMGYNEHGLIYSINTLSPLVLKPGNTPRTFVTRALLSARSKQDAKRILLDEGLGIGNGFSCNMLWRQPNGTVTLANVEVAPNLNGQHSLLDYKTYDAEGEYLVHANLYERIKLEEVTGPIIDSSKCRLDSIRRCPAPHSRKDIEKILSDTSGKNYQVFQKKNDAVISTIAAGVFDLQRGTWSLYTHEPAFTQPVAELNMRFDQADSRKTS